MLADLDDTGLEETRAALAAERTEVVTMRTDVSDRAQVQALADRAWSAFAAVHVGLSEALAKVT